MRFFLVWFFNFFFRKYLLFCFYKSCALKTGANQQSACFGHHTIMQWLANSTKDCYVFTQPLRTKVYDTKSSFKQSTANLNSEFFFSNADGLTKTKELDLPYYLPITFERDEFISFLGVLVRNETFLSLVQDLNSSWRLRFQRRWPLHSACVLYKGNYFMSLPNPSTMGSKWHKVILSGVLKI